MIKSLSYVFLAVVFLSACGKKESIKPSGIVPQKANKMSPSKPKNPTKPTIPTPANPSPTPAPASVLEGSWATDCLPNAEGGAKKRYVTVVKGLLTYQELSFSDPDRCMGPGQLASEYSAYIVVGPYEDSVVTHGVDEYDTEGNFLFTWYFRLEGNRFLDIREEFLTSRSTSDYGDYYNKIK